MKAETLNLISNVTLGEAGWRKKVYMVLILDCLERQNYSYEGLKSEIKSLLDLLFSEVDFEAAFQKSIEESKIVFQDDIIMLTEGQKRINELNVNKNKNQEIEAEKALSAICAKVGIKALSWERFRDYIVIKNVRHFILDGVEDDDIFNDYIANVEREEGVSLTYELVHSIVDEFIHSSSHEVRSYLAGNIYGYYNVESLGLTEEAVEFLKPRTGKTYNIRLLLDTNYIFSILQLHENPANDIILSINKIISKVSGSLTITYHVLPRTIKEFRASLEYEIKQINSIRFTIPIAKTIISTSSISGLMKKYAIRYLESGGKLSVADYFEPYQKNLLLILQDSGINLFNFPEDPTLHSEPFLEDLSLLTRKDAEVPEEQRRGMAKIEHDLLLWWSVKNSRPSVSESFLDANIWAATLDHRLIWFDKTKKIDVPVCLDPSKIIELLQIWLPRNEFLSDQLLNIIRLPQYDNNIDKETAEATRRILSVVSRYTTVDDLAEDTIHSILLNKKLRSSMLMVKSQEDGIELIHDELLVILEDSKVKLEALEAERNRLATDSLDKDQKIANLAQAQKEQKGLIEGMVAKINDIGISRNEVEQKLIDLAGEKARAEQENKMKDDIILKMNRFDRKWDEITALWYHLPLAVLLFGASIYWGWPWLKAVWQNTTLANFDIRALGSMFTIILGVRQLWKFDKIQSSFCFIFMKNHYKNKLKQELENKPID